MRTESRERAAVQARASRFLDDLCGWLAIPSIGADPEHHGEVARVTLPLLHRGAEAAAHLWRLLGSPTR